MEQVRIDRWLGAARVFKSRTQAATSCNGGHVKLNGQNAKPHQLVKVGDELAVRRGERLLLLRIAALAERRLSPPLALELYEDHSPPPPPRDESLAGRPTKRDRRTLRRLRRPGL